MVYIKDCMPCIIKRVAVVAVTICYVCDVTFLTFIPGKPVQVKNLDDGTVKTTALELFTYLNEVGLV